MAFFNDISLGHYYPAESTIHQLDPRTKLLAAMILMTCLLMSLNFVVLIAYLVLTTVVVKMSRIPPFLAFRNLRPFFLLFVATILVHLIWTNDGPKLSLPLVNLQISRHGLELGLVYALRLGILIVLAATLTLTTSPIELTDALEIMLKPLKRLRVPTHEIVMMLSLSLRFIPTLMEEADRLRKAQISRGARFSGHIFKRLKAVMPLVLPLFVSAFRRADELAYAMDARCYSGGEGRTSYKRLQFRTTDFIALAVVTTVSLFGIAVG